MSDEPKTSHPGFEIPLPAEGRRYVLFKYPKAKAWTASIVMPNGHKETFDTGKLNRGDATVRATQAVRGLYGKLGLESPADERKRTGELSAYRKLKIARGQAAPGSGWAANGKGKHAQREDADDEPLAPGPQPVATNGTTETGEWGSFVMTTEKRYMRAFMRIQELLLLGVADNPQMFVEHLRAIVIETMRGLRGRGG